MEVEQPAAAATSTEVVVEATAPVVFAEPAATENAPEVVVKEGAGIDVVVPEAATTAEAATVAAAPVEVAAAQEAVPTAEAQTPAGSAAASPRRDGKKPKAKPKKKPVRICGRVLDRIIKTRKAAGNFYHSNLFKCARSSNFNCNGDMRHFDCEVLSQLGPFAPGEKLKVIDWVASANLLFCSKTGIIADTVILPLASGSVESQVPMEP